jgi:RNA polymerase sigma-54 factor
MNWLAPKLHLRVAQKQILTPGLVQMVSVLALNRLELREMINQEMVENPVLEELSDDPVVTEDYSAEAFLKAETEKVPEIEPPSPFAEFDVASFFNQYLGSGGGNEDRGEREVDERPSFEQFLSSAQGLSEHLTWQLSVTVCNDIVREIADAIIGNLDENGYLSASLEEISQNFIPSIRRTHSLSKSFPSACRSGLWRRAKRKKRARRPRWPDCCRRTS